MKRPKEEAWVKREVQDENKIPPGMSPAREQARLSRSLRSAEWASQTVSQREHAISPGQILGTLSLLLLLENGVLLLEEILERVWPERLILQVRNLRSKMDGFTKAG